MRCWNLLRRLPAGIAVLSLILVSISGSAIAAAAASDLRAENTSIYAGDGRWDWTIYLAAPARVMDSVKCVEYTLHPTFPNPVRQVCDRGKDPKHPFGLESNGWGTFDVGIKVLFQDGRTTNLRHTLSFVQYPLTNATAQISLNNDAKLLRPGYWQWTAFVNANDAALQQIKCVQYTLHPTFPNPVREVCERGNGPRAFALTATGWGVFELKARVSFKDGRFTELTRNLKF